MSLYVTSTTCNTIIIVALGTRGDVQPLACIAQQLRHSSPRESSVVLITHRAHEPWLAAGIFCSLPTHYVDSPPAGAWWSQPQPGAASAGARSQHPDRDNSSGSGRLSEPDTRVLDAIRACASGAGGGARPKLPPLGQGNQALGRPGCSRGAAAGAPAPAAAASRAPTAASDSPTSPTSPTSPSSSSCAGPEQQPPGPQPRPAAATAAAAAAAIVVFNLFALEAYHAAEALGLVCAVAAPYRIPYTCPPAFRTMFARELPELFAALAPPPPPPSPPAEQQPQKRQEWQQKHQEQQRQGAQRRPDGAGGEGEQPAQGSRVTFAEVEHWMWPLFTERWGEWRERRLGLPALPLHELGPLAPRPPPSPSAEAAVSAACGGGGPASSEAAAGPGAWEREAVALPRERLPPAPPLLYGFSELLVPRPSYWPPSVHVCGFWQPPLHWFRGHRLPPALAGLVQQHGGGAGSSSGRSASSGAGGGAGRLVCVDFGSMGRLGLVPDPAFTLAVLRGAVERLGLVALVLTAGWLPLHEAAAALGGVELLEGGAGAAAGAAPAVEVAAVAADAASVGKGGSAVATEAAEAVEAAAAAEAAAGQPVLAPPPKRARTSGGGPCPPSTQVARWPGPPAASLYLYGSGDVPHQLLLPHCAAVLHTAGSGTTAAALQCGTPQVTCPLHFDQLFWAERLAHLGLSPPPLQRHLLFGSLQGPAQQARSRRGQPAGARVPVEGGAARGAAVQQQCPPPVPQGAASAAAVTAVATAAVAAASSGGGWRAGAERLRGCGGDGDGDGGCMDVLGNDEVQVCAAAADAAARVAAALRDAACNAARRRAAEAMAQELAHEDGLCAAVELLRREVVAAGGRQQGTCAVAGASSGQRSDYTGVEE